MTMYTAALFVQVGAVCAEPTLPLNLAQTRNRSR